MIPIEKVVWTCNGSAIDIEAVEVYPETVCQYTGLKDKNGVKIFEGDIDQRNRIVQFVRSAYYWIGSREVRISHVNKVNEYAEVIGNIHDKKEG